MACSEVNERDEIWIDVHVVAQSLQRCEDVTRLALLAGTSEDVADFADDDRRRERVQVLDLLQLRERVGVHLFLPVDATEAEVCDRVVVVEEESVTKLVEGCVVTAMSV